MAEADLVSGYTSPLFSAKFPWAFFTAFECCSHSFGGGGHEGLFGVPAGVVTTG